MSARLKFRRRLWLLCGLAWATLAALPLVAYPLIRAAYDGDSFDFLNALIRGQAERTIDDYVGGFNEYLFGAVTLAVIVTGTALAAELMRLVRTGRLGWPLAMFGNFAVVSGMYAAGDFLEASSLRQMAILLAGVSAAIVIAALLGKGNFTAVLVSARRVGLSTFAIFFVAFVSGELMLRIYFSSGESFGSRGGPIVAAFEKDFVLGGPEGLSRGPQSAGPDQSGKFHVLLQGDSITWGQGVQDEEKLFSSQLLTLLRGDGIDAAMSVLSFPGREIDGHLLALDKWAETRDTDLIVYQFFVNDMELDHSGRPAAPWRIWRRLFFHRILASHSYLWFFLDFNLDHLLPAADVSYDDYLAANFKPGSPGWLTFEKVFLEWAEKAKATSPSVLVALYPRSVNGEKRLADLYDDVANLCLRAGVDVIDLWPAVRQLAEDGQLFASPFDAHPGGMAHAAIAVALHEQIHSGGLLERRRGKP